MKRLMSNGCVYYADRPRSDCLRPVTWSTAGLCVVHWPRWLAQFKRTEKGKQQ